MFEFLNSGIGPKVTCDNGCGGAFFEHKGKNHDLGKLKGKYKFNIFVVCNKCGKKYCNDCYEKSVRFAGCSCGNGRNGEKAGYAYKACLEKL